MSRPLRRLQPYASRAPSRLMCGSTWRNSGSTTSGSGSAPSRRRRRRPAAPSGPRGGLSGSARQLRGDACEAGKDLLPVRLERLLLALGHEVDVELVDADRLELAQLGDALLGVADDGEAVGDLVGDELAVLGADAAVVLVVVELARLHELGQRL